MVERRVSIVVGLAGIVSIWAALASSCSWASWAVRAAVYLAAAASSWILPALVELVEDIFHRVGLVAASIHGLRWW